MIRHSTHAFASWRELDVPEEARPDPLSVRAQTIPARSCFPVHAHSWRQLVYAIDGVLNVAVEGRCFVVPPDQAVWVPSSVLHCVGSLHGAQYRSLYLVDRPGDVRFSGLTALGVSPLVRELIIEAAMIAERRELGSPYGVRLVNLLVDTIGRLEPQPFSLPWPRSESLSKLCEALFADPSDDRERADWARWLGMSDRTLARRCETELGMSLRTWQRHMRLFKAIELLGSGENVTNTALALGYNSTSAFTYMFRRGTGKSPTQFASIRRGPARDK
jgi:AraC-like DNA-binding protein